MNKTKILQQLNNEKIVAVIRGDDEKEVNQIAEAVVAGGINLLEITFTIPNAQNIIANLSIKYKNDSNVVVGAGTCLDLVTARLAILSGAQFIVCPHFDKEIIKLCNLYNVPVFPGATNIKDVKNCLTYGANIIKLFPGDIYGPQTIKSFKGPIPQADFMPTGGVSADNIKDWLHSGAVAVGTGGSLTKGAKTGNFEDITIQAQKLVQLVEEFKNE